MAFGEDIHKTTNTAGGGSEGEKNVQRDGLYIKDIAERPIEHLLHVKPQCFENKRKGE